eukprot:CAMPEP_0114390690 /NCGR_PEP_ID=MMETSP0102-20121206/9565_1 /TAXON_ID=38822 ORGANISM="Pteridomonas danica, Strain PT" /NCGR_SAMPLE_ID=MMETSP0102 /ASSEMBLY_ACC=CAM_ASM_000212 /LENGTH=110 /DNA_ID=CAMNT_0001549151 /DNA_START=9 /DNA_END=342 /DNA_ORIENTATION=-
MSLYLRSVGPIACAASVVSCSLTGSVDAEDSKSSIDFRMGVVADIQCCDIEDGENYARTVKRHYRGALQMLDRAVSFWKAKDIDYLCNLGDVIDDNVVLELIVQKNLILY